MAWDRRSPTGTAMDSFAPSFLYSSSSSPRSFLGDVDASPNGFLIAPPSDPRKKIEMYSPAFYAACSLGGILSSGLTSMALTPLDLVKCNMQMDPAKYKSISSGFGVLLREQGVRGVFRGWVPTLLGHSALGACRFGFYEFFKKRYSDIAGPEYKTLVYLASAASAEVIADVALCPFEAVKARVQSQPGFARGMSDGFPKFVKSEGVGGLYKVLGRLWGRQVPYTMMIFASFETFAEMDYKNGVCPPKEQCSKNEQLRSSFSRGLLAGTLFAMFSHPTIHLLPSLSHAIRATPAECISVIGGIEETWALGSVQTRYDVRGQRASSTCCGDRDTGWCTVAYI
ncbi:PREDICTED: mitochondrial phosphate carrier protein 3, mitochondrial-like isoform X2 [Tarenaya hassleriana]|uniref:mitochondrial phosphate carrier protein 3, mitochondrial-like isoform X2 n=1 Tax=Tarenaya hassleriana TaxID=28532 RepID=UPI00053C35CC|nr:PREDICTED: mitochondrial phosphate carrier protein 3, mitochondrial-like isoform X2 [Tarenaya hassleriana]